VIELKDRLVALDVPPHMISILCRHYLVGAGISYSTIRSNLVSQFKIAYRANNGKLAATSAAKKEGPLEIASGASATPSQSGSNDLYVENMTVTDSPEPTSENATVWYKIPRRLFSKLRKAMPKGETDDYIYVRFGRDLEAREILPDRMMRKIWAQQDGKGGQQSVAIWFEA
jgi:hypothetical protein